MADELDRRFKKAVWLIRNGPKTSSSNETKLIFYSYFKQATEGDVTVRACTILRHCMHVAYHCLEAMVTP